MHAYSDDVGAFLRKAGEYPGIRDEIEPPIPQRMVQAEGMILRFETMPSRSLHREFAELAQEWDPLEGRFSERLREYEARLPVLKLRPGDREVVRRGYAGLACWVQRTGEVVKVYGKAHRASEFAEAHASEFQEFLYRHAPTLHGRLQRGEEGRGGIIVCAGTGFELAPRPRGDTEFFTTLLAQAKSGDAGAADRLAAMLDHFLKGGARRALGALPPDEWAAEVSQADRDLNALRNGTVTPYVEAAVAAYLEGTYTHDMGVFADEHLFSRESPRRLFSFYQIHPADGNYPNPAYRGPHREEMRLSWDLGPQVVLAPEQQFLDSYLIIRGKIRLNKAIPA
ncbi:MAG: hypothetical protein HY520_02255 [Candidatus Aenigmarchaeota archaeon]|nr:hypothetical protein [Candidatus Aenigmarchaeota archaeon]